MPEIVFLMYFYCTIIPGGVKGIFRPDIQTSKGARHVPIGVQLSLVITIKPLWHKELRVSYRMESFIYRKIKANGMDSFYFVKDFISAIKSLMYIVYHTLH